MNRLAHIALTVLDYDEAINLATPRTNELAEWEATKGEIAHDKPDPEKALGLAKGHITMRAAEAYVVTRWFGGPVVVLSTETKKLVRYDNLVAPRDEYAHAFTMPFFPHRLDH